MKIEQAIKYTKQIQKEHPDRCLTGSLSLILLGMLPERDIRDIDFVSEKKPFSNEFTYDDLSPGFDDNRYKITKPVPYCLFVTKNVYVSRTRPEMIICQDPAITLWHKMNYGRQSDIDDMKSIFKKLIEERYGIIKGDYE